MTPRRAELLRDLDRATGRVLMVDGVEQSYVDVEDPTHLEFEYMQHMALAIDAVLPPPTRVTAVHLGGGAQTMPRWIAATRPGSRQVVVEGDAAVLDAVTELGPVERCLVVVGDAMVETARLPGGDARLLIWDLYDGPRADTAALTLEAVQSMRRLLADMSLLVMNVSDVAPFDVVRPVLAALRVTFADVALLAEPSTLRGRRSGNCVLLATTTGSLPLDELTRVAAAAPVRGRMVGGADLEAFIGDAEPASADRPLPPPDSSGRAFL